MNSYEEKQEARRQRYLDRASSTATEARALYDRAHKMAECIPFGQPILVGHHSEQRDRNFRAKIHNTFGKAFATEKAEYYRDKADSIGKGGISSDDPDAIEKLKEKVINLEAKQERMKEANKLIRKKDNSGLEKMGYSAEDIESLFKPDYGGIGFPSYLLTNNNATIRTTKKRIEELERAAQAQDKKVEYDGFTYLEEDNRAQFVFPGKPDEDVRAILKSYSFKWSPSRGAWVRMLNGSGRFAAKRVIDKLKAQNA